MPVKQNFSKITEDMLIACIKSMPNASVYAINKELIRRHGGNGTRQERVKVFKRHVAGDASLEEAHAELKDLWHRLAKKTRTSRSVRSGNAPTKGGVESRTFKQDGRNAEISEVTPKRIQSLEDLIAFFRVDTRKWRVKSWECTSYESHTKLRQGGEDTHRVVPLYRVHARLEENTKVILLDDLKAEVMAELRLAAVQGPRHAYAEKVGSPCMLEVNIFDVHFGKLVWGAETNGESYDAHIVQDILIPCVRKLLHHARDYNVTKIMFPVGNDFFNVNNKNNTTAAGTPQDEDGRWKKTFVAGRKLIMEVINILQEVAPVTIPVIPGNHDEERAFYLGDVLDAVYASSPDVTVDNSPRLRKYYQFGNSMVGYTHGRDEKIHDLPLLMAQEEPAMWAETKEPGTREWHLGDKHHMRETKWVSGEEFKGVVVRVMRSIASSDEWHYKKGYVGNKRAGEAFVWDESLGVVAQFTAVV